MHEFINEPIVIGAMLTTGVVFIIAGWKIEIVMAYVIKKGWL